MAYDKLQFFYGKILWLRALFLLSFFNFVILFLLSVRRNQEGIKMSGTMNHFDKHGNAVMVDVSGKEASFRMAVAEGKIFVSKEILDAVAGNAVK